MTEEGSTTVVTQQTKQGAAIGGWICFVLGAAIMYFSVWTFILYVPLFFVAFVLSIVAMAQRRVVMGLLLLLATLVLPPVQWLVLSATRVNKFIQDHPVPVAQPANQQMETARPNSVALPTPERANATEQAKVDSASQQSIADAHAWQIEVAHKRVLVTNTTVRPVFSEDSQTVTYTQQQGNSASIVVARLRDNAVVATWTPPQPPVCIAWSQDGKRLAYKTREEKLHIVEWDSRKDTLLPLTYKFEGSPIAWIASDQLASVDDGRTFWILDLDSLNVEGFKLPTNLDRLRLSPDQAGKVEKFNRLVGASRSHAHCDISADGFPGGGLYTVYMFVKEKDGSYQRLLSDTAYNGVSVVSRFMYSVSPDLRHVLVSQGGDKWEHLVLGLRETRNMSFRVDFDLDKHIKDRKDREQFEKFRTKKVKFWGMVYAPSVNPLNGKVVGPDRSAFRGEARVSRWDNSYVVVTTSKEVKPLKDGDIFTEFRSGESDGGYWYDGDNTWLPLLPVKDVSPGGLN